MAEAEQLILYHQPLCGFCWSVREVIEELGVTVELRDIFADSEHRDALHEARGNGVVPVLRRVSTNGESDWMPESGDIIRYLLENYGEAA